MRSNCKSFLSVAAATIFLSNGVAHAVPPIDAELGVVSAASPQFATPVMSLAAGQVRWVHFRTMTPTSAATHFLDMHTFGSNIPTVSNDTEIGLYNAQGQKIDDNDDWPFGPDVESGLSFGRASAPRAYATLPNFAGQDGPTLPAGHYYVAITAFGAEFGQNFTVTTSPAYSGQVKLSIITNLPGGTAACNRADVAGLGGVSGPDHQLTADDIVLFLSSYFSSTLAIADIAGLGGSAGADGQLTVDDLVLFLAAFFSPCNP
ncbi:MAG: GC-type dockerin domain-anchored protein [Phycisphaerales bacterium]